MVLTRIIPLNSANGVFCFFVADKVPASLRRSLIRHKTVYPGPMGDFDLNELRVALDDSVGEHLLKTVDLKGMCDVIKSGLVNNIITMVGAGISTGELFQFTIAAPHNTYF